MITLSAPGSPEVAWEGGAEAAGGAPFSAPSPRSSTRGADRVAPSASPDAPTSPAPGGAGSSAATEGSASPGPSSAPSAPAGEEDRQPEDRRQGEDRPAIFSLPDPATADGWVRAVARTFVNVRAQPASDSEVQGIVAENDVVFLGDARGAWRQVRTTAGVGWVWEPLFQVGSEGP